MSLEKDDDGDIPKKSNLNNSENELWFNFWQKISDLLCPKIQISDGKVNLLEEGYEKIDREDIIIMDSKTIRFYTNDEISNVIFNSFDNSGEVFLDHFTLYRCFFRSGDNMEFVNISSENSFRHREWIEFTFEWEFKYSGKKHTLDIFYRENEILIIITDYIPDLKNHLLYTYEIKKEGFWYEESLKENDEKIIIETSDFKNFEFDYKLSSLYYEGQDLYYVIVVTKINWKTIDVPISVDYSKNTFSLDEYFLNNIWFSPTKIEKTVYSCWFWWPVLLLELS